MKTTLIFHRGAPSHPPIVNGVTFAESPDHPGFFVGEASKEQAAMFAGIPHFHSDPNALMEAEPAVAPQTPVATDGRDYLGEIDTLTQENEGLKETIVDLNAKLETVATENEELRAKIAELEAEEDAGSDLEILKAEIANLEEKKAAGQTSAAENMKLGKLNNKLKAMLATK